MWLRNRKINTYEGTIYFADLSPLFTIEQCRLFVENSYRFVENLQAHDRFHGKEFLQWDSAELPWQFLGNIC